MPRRNDISKILIIGSGPNRFVGLAASFLFFFLLIPFPAQPCSRSLDRIRVSPDFRIIVTHDATPVPGIQVEVCDEESVPVLKLVTSRDGSAEVKSLRKGTYLVATSGPGRGSAVYAVVAERSDKSRNEISLEWPFSWRGTLKTRSLSGELVTNNPFIPFQNVHVQLWAAGLETPLAVVDTGPQGRFGFDETRPGIYVVRIQGRQDKPYDQIEGDLSVELAPSAPDAVPSLALRLEMTTCGIEYNSCLANETPIATSSRRIQVMCKPGMCEFPGIENAKYRLLDDHGALIAEGATDHEGIAQLPPEFVGRVTLVVAFPLTATVQQALDLLPVDEHAPTLLITMTADDSECSAVSLEKHATPQ
jgi:hypothetical protein